MTSSVLLLKQHAAGLTADEKLQFQSQLTSRLRNNGVGVALALLIGGLGAHKFYLKQNGAGIVYLLCGTVGWTIIVPGIIVIVLCIIDAINMSHSTATFNTALAREIKAELEAIR